MKVAVLGCGPAGLLAAHAAVERDCEVTIYSNKVMSPIGGAQYLHEAIPDVTPEEPTMVAFAKVGDRAGYARKVYGDPTAPVSWDIFTVGEYPAWSLQMAYRRLWTRYEDQIKDWMVIGIELATLCRENHLVFSSVPRRTFCRRREHVFKEQPIGLLHAAQIDVDNLVVYNGREEDEWTRTSLIFGHGWTEYPASSAVDPLRGGSKGVKPISHDCDCFDELENLTHIGRFGKWKKGVLTNHAYHDAREAVERAMLKL